MENINFYEKEKEKWSIKMFIETFILVIFIRRIIRESYLLVHTRLFHFHFHFHTTVHILCTETMTLSHNFNSKSAQLCVRGNVK